VGILRTTLNRPPRRFVRRAEGVHVAADRKEEADLTKRALLAGELRRIRELRGMTGRELAQRVRISQSKVSRIESGRTVPTLSEVSAWAIAADASDETREWLVELAESVHTEVHSWPVTLQMRTHIQDEIEERELHARVVRSFQSSVVPGLLQTAEYARRMFTMGEVPKSAEVVAESLDARLRRQQVMFEENRRFEFVLTEAALRWRPGPARLMLGQLDRVTSLSTLDNVSVGVIPLDTEATTFSTHAFVLYEELDDDQDPFVEVEAIHANLIVNDAANVGMYRARWERLAAMAIFGDEARAWFAERAAALRMEL
jgi:transcriptional regulator with XRE-family HTH domain